jgi:magnesium transporter
LQAIQTKYNLHNLAVEDVVNQNQRPKIESYDDHEHIVLLSAEPGDQISLNQVNLFLEEGLVISIMDKPGAWTAPVRKRIREGGSRIQTSGADYLGYALMDAVVDHYFPIVDGYASHLTALEKAALGHPTQQDIIDIHVVSNELMSLRRAILPLKDMTKQLHSESHARIHKKNRIYFRDCSDHVMRLLDELEADRDFSRNLVNTCLSTMSNRMNEIMKLLTVISTIFIPLSFIAGIYGMNFNPETSPYNMPELGWRFGYLFAWLLMVIIALTMLVFFRMKGWLGGSRGTLRDTRIR